MDFVPAAASANTFEIETSRLALARSRDPEIRRFASRMIADHTAATRSLTVAARASGMPVGRVSLDARQRDVLDDLEAVSPGEFDGAFIDTQVIAHQESVALFADFARRGDDPALMRFAADTLPTLQRHLDEVEGIQGRIVNVGPMSRQGTGMGPGGMTGAM